MTKQGAYQAVHCCFDNGLLIIELGGEGETGERVLVFKATQLATLQHSGNIINQKVQSLLSLIANMTKTFSCRHCIKWILYKDSIKYKMV